jgi:hypothetical protein
MGACYYWGAAGPCYAFYPAFGNFGIYDEFARLRKGGAADPAFIDRWLAQFTGPEFEPHLKTYGAHVNWSVNFFSGGRWRPAPGSGRTGYVIPYTNARAVNWGEEVRTFLDEWSNLDIADPRWPGEERFIRAKDGGYRLAAYGKVATPGETDGVAYAIDPVPSWQDMVLFYHKRMLETFADGIYFDDYFLAPNYNPLGPGYVDEEGKLHAGVPVKTLTLARQGKAMLVVASYGPAGDVVLELDKKSLALSDNVIAADAETGGELQRLGPGRFKLALPRHDFRLILVEQRSPQK